MTQEHKAALKDFMEDALRRNPHEVEFLQAVEEVATSLIPFLIEHKEYKEARILERICEPERIVIFSVPWLNDKGEFCLNRGYRVQMNSAIGPYKGGLRFHPTVNLSVLKFLAFEQVFKNSLTTLPLGAAKGGADFNPKGKSDNEVMNFCQSFMNELFKYIGHDKDVPAGDIGVGSREIGFLFGQYKRLQNRFNGILTGKGLSYGGSLIRAEATGYGSVYFAQEMLKTKGEGVEGKTCVVSGAGNVAIFTTKKLLSVGAKVVTLSDSSGFIHDKEGIDEEKLEYLMDLKLRRRGRLYEYAEKYGCEYHAGRPWHVPCDIAFPSATQNELDESEAKALVENGCKCVSEGANMPSTSGAVKVFQEAKILYGPGKAANAGGVAVSGLEISQNASGIPWTAEEVDSRLHHIMQEIHEKCLKHGKSENYVDYVKGANIAGFIKVADAMLAQGLV